MQVDRVTGVSRTSLIFLMLAVCNASLSVIFHSRIHALSHVFLFVSGLFAFFSLLKLVNGFASWFPRRIEVFLHWIYAMPFELLALIAVPMMRILRFSKTFQKPVGNLQGRPILLIHGYCNDGSAWSYLKHRLAKESIGPIYTIDLSFPFRSIYEYALEVKEKAAQIRNETNRTDLVLIGHSMGGLVSSLYTTDFAPPETVTDVITIGSPLGGTHVAKIGIGPNAKEMECSSEFISQLHVKIAKERFSRFYHIATNTDQLVIPCRSALLKNNPSREFLFEDIGHASLLFSPRVGSLIACWLKEAASKEASASEIA
jgi:triacylglycerol lipase